MIAENLYSRTHVAICGLLIFGKGVGHILLATWECGKIVRVCVL